MNTEYKKMLEVAEANRKIKADRDAAALLNERKPIGHEDKPAPKLGNPNDASTWAVL